MQVVYIHTCKQLIHPHENKLVFKNKEREGRLEGVIGKGGGEKLKRAVKGEYDPSTLYSCMIFSINQSINI